MTPLKAAIILNKQPPGFIVPIAIIAQQLKRSLAANPTLFDVAFNDFMLNCPLRFFLNFWQLTMLGYIIPDILIPVPWTITAVL